VRRLSRKIIWWSVVILWMSVIFCFSAQPASESNALSSNISEKIIEFVKNIKNIPVFAFIDADALSNFVIKANHYVRKTAHFMIFAVLGNFVYNLFYSYGISRLKNCFFAVLVCLLYAISDEIHQIFVPGRACSVTDVLIDFCGAASSVGLTALLFTMLKKRKAL